MMIAPSATPENLFFNTAEPPLTAASLQRSPFLADSPYTDSCFKPLYHGRFLLSQGGRSGEVQLGCTSACQLMIAPSATPATGTQKLFYFSFRSFGKHRRARQRGDLYFITRA